MNIELLTTAAALMRSQLQAMSRALQILEQQLVTTQPQPVDDETVCPKCGSEVSDISTMGYDRPQWACIKCDFRGEIPGAVRG